MFNNSKWIWAEGNLKRDDRALFRKKINVIKPPKTAIIEIAASDSYNLYVNGKLVVYDGGLSRGTADKRGYYDQVDISRYINKGENVIGFKCVYYGIDGNGSQSAGAAGLIFSCEELELYSDKETLVYRPDNYSGDIKADQLSYTGGNLYYDANKGGDITNVFEVIYGSTVFTNSCEFGEYMTEPFGELILRPLPLYGFDNVSKAKVSKTTEDGENVYLAEIGDAMFFAPIIEVTAMGGEKITIISDRYFSEGRWGENKRYTNQRIEYTCKNASQIFESDIYLSGTGLKITAPASVKVNSVSYRRTFYASNSVAQFKTDDKRIDTLINKSINTLESCMRANFIDTPDRMRGINLFTFSMAARAAAYMFDESTLKLIKKTISDIVTFSGEKLMNDANSPCPRENVIDSLMFLSNYGAVDAYYNRTGDNELLGELYNKMCDYLMLWTFEDDNLVLRSLQTDYIDSGYNIDREIIETVLYCSACEFLVTIKDCSPLSDKAEQLELRAKKIRNNFNKYYTGEGYSSLKTENGYAYDDRATALIALNNLYQEGQQKQLIDILQNVFNCSPSYEPLALEAAIALGNNNLAFNRLLGRNLDFIESNNPTLPEYYGGGAQSYSASAGILSVLFSGFLGIKFFGGERVEIAPSVEPFSDVKFTIPVQSGEISGAVRGGKGDIVIDNNTSIKVNLIQGEKINVLPKGKSKNSN